LVEAGLMEIIWNSAEVHLEPVIAIKLGRLSLVLMKCWFGGSCYS